jgi:hypothetical protein
VNWIHLAHDMDQWRTVVDMVMNFRVPKTGGEFLDKLNDCRFCSMELGT